MKMNRRNVLVGLGGIVASGGALLGTGAFSQVEAKRDVTIDVADDANALVGLEAKSSYVTDEQEYNNNQLAINLDSTNLGGEDAEGLNIGTTTIDEAFAVVNNHNSDINVTIEDKTFQEESVELNFTDSSDPFNSKTVTDSEDVFIEIVVNDDVDTSTTIEGEVKITATPAPTDN